MNHHHMQQEYKDVNFKEFREIDESLDNFKLDPEPQKQEMNIKTEQQIYANVFFATFNSIVEA